MASSSAVNAALHHSNTRSLSDRRPSPLSNMMSADDILSDSDSVLSDVEPPMEASPTPSHHGQSPSSANDEMDIETPNDSEADNGLGSDDADFDIETPPVNGSADVGYSRSTSQESRRSTKRKAANGNEDDFSNNPELYGLRRSGRARASRNVIQTIEDEDEDEDIANNSRKRRKTLRGKQRVTSKSTTPLRQSTSVSDSDSDTYGTAKSRAKARMQRRRQLEDGTNLVPSHAEIRFSTRRAGKVNNYNEGDENSLSDEDSVLTPNYGAGGAGQSSEGIDVVLTHRLKDGVSASEEPAKGDIEYHIKWLHKAHYHATWETVSSLAGAGYSTRKVDNYFRKFVQEDFQIRNDDQYTLEEREKWILDREQSIDALNDWVKVERVIDSREGDEDTEYYIKWKTLPYGNCTWETATLISEIAQPQIDAYLDRTSKVLVSDKSESNPATRKKHVHIREQPEYVKHGILRDFQLVGLNFLAYNWSKSNNVILADEMGLGKTVQTVAFMSWLVHERKQQGPFIVVVPLTTVPAWAETLDNWAPDINYVVFGGDAKSRQVIKDHEMLVDGNFRQPKFNVLITTYEYAIMESSYFSQIKWQFLAVDEAHRLKNRDSNLYAHLLSFKAPSRLLITGTPMQNTLGELSSLMDFLMPGRVKIEEDMDLQSAAAGEKIAELTKEITPYMLRRTKNKVENDLPPKSEKIIRMDLSDAQLEYYKNILTRNYAALNKVGKGEKTSLLNIMMELKKASNHPFLFPNFEDEMVAKYPRREDMLKAIVTSSGKMMALDHLLRQFKTENHRVLIFSQMVKMLDIIGDYLQLRGHQFQRLDGTIAASQRRQAIDHFNAPDSKDFCFLLSTRAGGLGINLMTADTVILFDSDWNPQADLQAMARAHRIGQKKPVSIYRLVSKGTVEEEVLTRARNKLVLEYVTIQGSISDKAAQDLTNKLKENGAIGEALTPEDINKILMKRGKSMFQQSGNQKALEEMTIDDILGRAEEHHTISDDMQADGGVEFLKSFDYVDVKLDLNWDDIIPKEQLEEIKAEEKRKDEAEYLAAVIEQNQPRKRKAPADEQREERAAKKRTRSLAAIESREQSYESNDLDPQRPLNEKEIRNLHKAYLRYGSLEDRGDEISRDAGLASRDPQILKATLEEIIDISKSKLHDEEARLAELEQSTNKSTTKKDKKAIIFDFRGVKRLNAETIVDRPREMRAVREAIAAWPDWRKFRIAEANKATNYTASWGAREDGMLCVGINKHGYGAWAAIRDDEDLEMKDKLFLEEHRVEKKTERVNGEEKNAKSPGAVHLVRRADYLISVLMARSRNANLATAKKIATAKKMIIDDHLRATKKNGMGGSQRSNKASASPAPSVPRKGLQSEQSRPRKPHGEHVKGVMHRHSNSENGHRSSEHRYKPYVKGEERKKLQEQKLEHRQPKSPEQKRDVSGDSILGPDDIAVMETLFSSFRDQLNSLRNATKEGIPDGRQRGLALKEGLITIGNRIETLLRGMNGSGKKDRDDRDLLEKKLWSYVLTYWPGAMAQYSQLKDMFERLVAADKKAKTVETNSNGQANGGAC